ncbi:pyroglutamyl-peptidase I [Levilactobacillus suantsaii]|uniref:Pyrrolidone-carboxylate peptidase n=1 Tax=Levilactobacillus suantsaii TaxID=2292255 RepID=A0A4V1LFC7_9LACO|nr:pyroglutamyl-peptidase I [Levilactobacillus suantsaii]RXI78590.1 pyroglutamyl-peptidase I [Levilactobacillus suantsaii]
MKILVTGFDPFAGAQQNPAWEAVSRLPQQLGRATIVSLQVPTIFNRSAAIVHAAIQRERPDVVVSVGQAGGRSALSLERVAINLDDARIADNAGQAPHDQPIQLAGATAYFTQLPVKAMRTAIRQAGVPAQLSTTAGIFVCNHLMYQVQYQRATEFSTLKAGFIHIPYLPSQVVDRPGVPSLALTEAVKGLTAALSVL